MIDTVVGHNTESLRALVASLARVDEQVTDAERIDQLAVLEALKSAVAAAQVRVTVGFVASQEQVAQGWREHARTCADAGDFDGWRQARDNADRASLNEPDQGRQAGQRGGSGENSDACSDDTSRGRSRKRPALANGIAAQVALARHESPHRGNQHVTLALTLHRHLPNVMGWLSAGVLSEWRATLIVRECAVLTQVRSRPGSRGQVALPQSVDGASEQHSHRLIPGAAHDSVTPPDPRPCTAGGASGGGSGIGDGHRTLEPSFTKDLAVDALRRERRQAHYGPLQPTARCTMHASGDGRHPRRTPHRAGVC